MMDVVLVRILSLELLRNVLGEHHCRLVLGLGGKLGHRPFLVHRHSGFVGWIDSFEREQRVHSFLGFSSKSYVQQLHIQRHRQLRQLLLILGRRRQLRQLLLIQRLQQLRQDLQLLDQQFLLQRHVRLKQFGCGQRLFGIQI